MVADDDFTLARDLIALAYADGKLTEDEKETISRICQLKDMSSDVLDPKHSRHGNQCFTNIPKTAKAREDYIVKMIQVMGADADCSAEEVFLLEIMADKLGFNKMQLLSIVLMNSTRKNFPGDYGTRVLDSFLKRTINIKVRNESQNRQCIAQLYDAIASQTPSSRDEEEDKCLLRNALHEATSVLLKNSIQQEEFRNVGLSFKEFLESEEKKAYMRWSNC